MLSFDKIRRGSPHVQNIGFQEHADKIIAQHDIIHLHIIPRSMFTHRIRLLAGNADSLIPNGTNVHDYDHCATTTLTLTRDTQDTACISGKSTLHVKRQTQSKDPRMVMRILYLNLPLDVASHLSAKATIGSVLWNGNKNLRPVR